MTLDPFQNSANSLIAPARSAFPISPNDTNDLPEATRAIFVGEGGDITVRMVGNDSDSIFRNVSSGTLLPLRIKAVRANGTTAAQILGLA